jgi:hypothetical protein
VNARLSLAAAILLAMGSAHAAILRVPEDYPSVLAAADAAVSGDSVLVGPGVWTDRATRTVSTPGGPRTFTSAAFLKAGITVIGVEGAASTVVDGGEVAGASVCTMTHVGQGTDPVHIEGLTITGGGEGALVWEATPIEFARCHFVENGRNAVAVRAAEVTLLDCVIEDNCEDMETYSAAIDGWSGDWDPRCNLELRGCRIGGNYWGGVKLRTAYSAIIDDCEITDHADHPGASFLDVRFLEIRDSVFLRNSVSSPSLGGALSIYDCDGEIAFCVFGHDSVTAGGQAGALYVGSSNVIVENNTFYGCYAYMGAAATISGSDAGFRRNIVTSCRGGAALIKWGGAMNPSSGCNLLWDNEGGDFYGDWEPAQTDIFADPQFCDAAAGDYSLHSTSPAAPENSPTCGLIGALGVDCGPISIESTSWGRIKNLYR